MITKTEAFPPEGEALWLRLSSHLQWCNHFALGFLFSSHPLVIETLRLRLSELHRTRVTRLESFRPSSTEELKTTFLERLLHPQEHLRALQAPLWIDLSRDLGDEWREARSFFLARLNERREPLRRAWQRPVVLIFPTDEHDLVRRVAPDLWAIRTFTFFTPSSSIAKLDRKLDFAQEFEGRSSGQSLADRSALREWERISTLPTRDRGYLLAGARAFEASRRAGEFESAIVIATQLLACARDFARKSAESPETLRDLSISCDMLGMAQRDLGDFEGALVSFRQSLEFRRRLRQYLGEMPDVLRNVSVSLDNIGHVHLVRGDLDAASDILQESVELTRLLRQRLGETPLTLRDLSVSLTHLGNAQREAGDIEAARRSFGESLYLNREILKLVGDTPVAVRDLYVALSKVGDLHRDLGELDAALSTFRECLELTRSVLHRAGETPETLRDQFVFMIKVGDALFDLGEFDDARRTLYESLELAKRIAQIIGETPQGLFDLVFVQERLGEVELKLGTRSEGSQRLREALDLACVLCNRFPGIAVYDAMRARLCLRVEELGASPVGPE